MIDMGRAQPASPAPSREFWAEYRRALMIRIAGLKMVYDADSQLLLAIERQFGLGRGEEPPKGR